jgi:hypothetical protein
MMTPNKFVNTIIRPANEALGLGSFEAEQIMLGTALQESNLQNVQQHNGPALGYFQDEPIDHNDLWKNYLKYHKVLGEKLMSLLPPTVGQDWHCLIMYPLYAAGVCRLHYLRAPGAIPLDLIGQANYYKAYYNTAGGAATIQEYVNKWNAIVGVSAIDNWGALMSPNLGV